MQHPEPTTALYIAPEPRLWPGHLPRPSCNQIASAVATSLRISSAGSFLDGNRVLAHIIPKRMFGLLASRIRGMSTPEIARFLGVESHTAFTKNGDWACEFCRSAGGTAMYNEIVRALEVEAARDHDPLDYTEAARLALKNHAGSAV